MWIHQRVGIHRFRWENPWIFFKKSTPFFSTDVRHYPGGDFLQTPGTPRLVEIWCFFFVFPTDMRDSARRFLCVFFRVEGGRYRLYILWKYMTWIYTFHSEALSRKWAELWWNRWSLMSTSLSPKKRLCMFQNINKGWTPTVNKCLSVFQCHLFGATLRITCTLAILLGFPLFLDTSTRVLLADAPSFSDAIFVVPPPQGGPLPVIK